MTRIKQSQLAGTWYARGARGLAEQVDGLLAAAGPAATTALTAVLVPHAGYVYSGRAAAAAYACVRDGGYARAVIMAPSHFAAFRGIGLLDADAFETPLGRVPIDAEAVASLGAQPCCRERPEAYLEEHSLEIQLPLLQRVLPQVRVVPVLIGELRRDDEAAVVAALEPLADARTLFVVSSDFVHYGARFGYLPFPPAGAAPVRAALRALDMGAIEQVCAGDVAGFRRYVDDSGATICGRAPIAAFLALHRRRTPGRLLMYYTSLDVTGDYEHCVSYASIAFPRPS